MWKQSKVALDFFAQNDIPFWEMKNADELVDRQRAYCLSKPGEAYLVFAKHATGVSLDLSSAEGVFEVKWYNPRVGGPLHTGSTHAVIAGGKVDIGQPATDSQRDWLAVLTRGDPKKDYPPGVSAGEARTTMMPRSGEPVSVGLSGKVTDDRSDATLTGQWSVASGPADVVFADAESATTQATFSKPGSYKLKLIASDGNQSSTATTVVKVEPFQSKVTRSIRAIDDAFTEGASVLSNQYLKLEHKRRSSIIKFDLEGLPPTILDVALRLHQSGDTGGGTLQVFRVAKSEWIGSKLLKEDFPTTGKLLGEFKVSASGGQAVSMPIPELLDGDGQYSVLVTMKPGGDDVWFASTASGKGPELVITFEDPEGKYKLFGQASGVDGTVLSAIEDFRPAVSGEFVPGYSDTAQKARAINAAKYRDKFSAAESYYDGPKGEYDLVLTTLTETDGESSYRVLVEGKAIGSVQNPASSQDYRPVAHRFNGVQLKSGDALRVEFNSASNGKIPEGDGFAFSRGRWRSLIILNSGAVWNEAGAIQKPSTPAATPFEFNYDPTQAKKVHIQTDVVVVVEAEDFDAVNLETHRKWYRTTVEHAPGIKPDPDPSHAEGASGGAYLEILPDTRVTHADPLVNGVSFSNQPGECSVLYYPVEIKTPGRYYVWVRMCCTGSEDNGLHVGLDGRWPESGARLQFTGQHGQWQWDSRQRTDQVHTGVLGQIWLDVDEPGLHTIMFSMREDGFEFDKFMLTKEEKPMESKSLKIGPKASPRRP